MIVINDVSLTWPEGRELFSDISCSIGPGISALIGNNGSGKSTLLKLIAGRIPLQSGSIRVDGSVGYVAQDIDRTGALTVSDILLISDKLQALTALAAGDFSDSIYEVIADDWDVESRAQEILASLGLGGLELDRATDQLSGGEVMLLTLAAQFLASPDVLLLDEPTNNLDSAHRERLYRAVESWKSTLLLVSHDLELLNRVNRIGELHDGTLQWFTGNFDDYAAIQEAEQEQAEQRVRDAKQEVRREERVRSEAQTASARSLSQGKKATENKKYSKVYANLLKAKAQKSAGKRKSSHDEQVTVARDKLQDAQDAVRDDASIRVLLPATEVPRGKVVAKSEDLVLRNGAAVAVYLQGPQRVWVAGNNGVGKTTLFETMAGELEPLAGQISVNVPFRYLPQKMNILDDRLTILQNVTALAPTATNNDIRASLARFLFRGARADQIVGSLSGGERLRATLAALLLAEPAPQLLMLDEPTNNLDMASVEQLASALDGYQGALLVTSHDKHFLKRIGITDSVVVG